MPVPAKQLLRALVVSVSQSSETRHPSVKDQVVSKRNKKPDVHFESMSQGSESCRRQIECLLSQRTDPEDTLPWAMSPRLS